jgi:hypothetical protein
MAMLTGLMPSVSQRIHVVLITNNVEPGQGTAPIPDELSRAAVLWEQYDQRSSVAARDEVRSRVPTDCAVIRYPSVAMNALWPFRVKDPRNRPDPPAYPWGRYPHGDVVAMEVAEMRLPPARAFKRYMELSHERMPDVSRLVERERSVLQQRDDRCDVQMTDFVFANLRKTHQFWTHGHLAAGVVAELILRLLRASRPVIGDLGAAAHDELEDLCERFPGQGDIQAPVHPLIIEQLGLQFFNESTLYRYFTERWTFAEYMTRYIAFDCSW